MKKSKIILFIASTIISISICVLHYINYKLLLAQGIKAPILSELNRTTESGAYIWWFYFTDNNGKKVYLTRPFNAKMNLTNDKLYTNKSVYFSDTWSRNYVIYPSNTNYFICFITIITTIIICLSLGEFILTLIRKH